MVKKVIITVLLIIIAFILVHTIRNYIILTNIQNNNSKYKDSNNYHMRIISSQDNGMIVTTNFYRKENKKAVFIERELNGEKSKISMYDDGNNHHTYTEANNEKIVSLDSGFIEVQLTSITDTESFLQKIIVSFCSNIKNVNEDGKKYYNISNLIMPNILSTTAQVVYINAETGLVSTMIESDSVIVREYEFDNVDDSVFIEPDINEYKIQQ